MAYLRNSTINLLNLHYGLHSVAMNAGGVFFAVFLLKAGVSATAVLGALAMILGGRFCARPLVLAFGKRLGIKPLLVFCAVTSALQYPLLARVHGIDVRLLELCIASSISDAFYWTSYHAYFASLGDEEHRGHQISAREALASVVGIVAPLIGGWALVALGPIVAFGSVGVVQMLSALPLLGTPNVRVAMRVEGAFRASLAGFVLFAADGWIASGYVFVWQISLFLLLGSSFTAFGGAMAATALVGAGAGLLLGRHIDAGHGRRAVWLAFGVLAATILLRAAVRTPALAILANAAGALVGCLYIPTLMTAVYNLAKRSPCVLRFHFMAEGAWDLGCGGGCLAAAALTAVGAPLMVGVLLSLGGAVTALVVLRRYYARSAVPASI
ncbi:MAG TPA: hypothetical protein VIJ94_08585 [Caulobacteraceae bacterium]